MKVLISGICGFAGSCIAEGLLDFDPSFELLGFDNLSRAGSQLNVERLRRRGVKFIHADARSVTDLELIPPIHWVIDAAANPSVLAGVDGQTSSRQLIEHNLYGTVNLLELAKRHCAGFILLSTSRVYSLCELSKIPLIVRDHAFRPDPTALLPSGLTVEGVAENFCTAPPVSLYGVSKLASEYVALEYGETFGLPIWINRCGVLAGAGQFGHADQGIFSFWINAYLRRIPLNYIGWGGTGYQTRDCLHPRDLVPMLHKQMTDGGSDKPRLVNFGGGKQNSMSLARLSQWCSDRFGVHHVGSEHARRKFDVPWLVLDSRLAREIWSWQPAISLEMILEEIAQHAADHPEWLDISAPLSATMSAV